MEPLLYKLLYLCKQKAKMKVIGIVFFLIACIVQTIYAEDKGKYIGSIVFGGIFDNPPAIIGGIFGIIALDHFKEPKKQPAEEQVADEVVE